MATTGITIQLNAVDQTAAAVEAARGRFVAMQQSISARSATISESGKKALSGWEQFGAPSAALPVCWKSVETSDSLTPVYGPFAVMPASIRQSRFR